MAEAFTLFGDRISGNCLKVAYVADYLKLPFAWREVDVVGGETRRPDFLKLNPAGQVPVVQWADGRTLAQSNAIIRYLARGSDLLPEDGFAQARIDAWLFWEQYSHEPYVAVARFQKVYLGQTPEPRVVARGDGALDRLELALNESRWLANEAFSIADVALLAYTRLAHEGGFSLAARPRLRDWIARCEARLGLSPAEAAR